MLALNEGKNNVAIVYNGKEVFTFKKNEKIVSIGNGRAKYKMSRGSFKFWEKVNQKTDLFFGKQSSNEQGLLFELNDKTVNIR